MSDPFDSPPPKRLDPFDAPPSVGGDVDSATGALVGAGYRANPEAVSTVPERVAEGFKGGVPILLRSLEKLGVGAANPMFPDETNALSEDAPRREKQIAAYELKRPSLGLAGAVGEGLPKQLAMAPFIGALGSGLAATPLMARLGGMALPVSDVAVNAGVSAGEAALEGGDPGQAALFGGVGAGVGRMFGGTAGNVTNRITRPISEDAARAKAAGLRYTVGQAYPGGIREAVENQTRRLPGVGRAVEAAQGRVSDDYLDLLSRNALDPIGGTPRGTGLARSRNMKSDISDSYERLKPDTWVDPSRASQAVVAARQDIAKVPLNGIQAKEVEDYIAKTLMPEITQHGTSGKNISGELYKRIDEQLGYKAHRYLTGINPGDEPIGHAFLALQKQWRGARDTTTPEVNAAWDATDLAFSRAQPIRKATETAASQGGNPTPLQLRRAIQARKGQPDALNDSAVTLSEQGNVSLGRDSMGTVAGVTAGSQGAGGVASLIAAWTGLSALGKAAYSNASVKGQLALMSLPHKVRKAVEAMPGAQQAKWIADYTRPFTQAGRIAGEHLGEENAP